MRHRQRSHSAYEEQEPLTAPARVPARGSFIPLGNVYNMAMIDGYLTTAQASAQFGLSAAHIRRLLEYSTLKGVKAGHDWLLEINSIEEYMTNRPRPGRKPKRESQ